VDSKDSEIVLSSRIRFARNIKEFPFPYKADKKTQIKIRDKILSIVKNISYFKKSEVLFLEELSNVDKRFLVERHLISYDLAKSENLGAIVIGDKEIVSLMINEEDHLRIQGIMPGLKLFDVFNILNVVDDEISKNIEFAYDDNIGYLTSCPTNVGTGLRASVLLHLPSIVKSGKIEGLLESLNRLGMVARGFYGEGTKSLGDFFQVSNQITLGFKEEEIIDKLKRIIQQMISTEKDVREELYKGNKIEIEDKVFRSYGILKYATKISYTELMENISWLRMGLGLNINVPVELKKINQIMLISQPAHLEERLRKEINYRNQEVERAKLIKSIL